MKKYLILLLGFVLCPYVRGENNRLAKSLSSQAEIISLSDELKCDTVVSINGYAVRVVKNNGEIRHIGLNLFSDVLKTSVYKDFLNYIEEALLAKSLKIKDRAYDKLVISKGRISDFKDLTPETACTVTTNNSKTMSVEWTKDNKTVSITIPIGYDTSSKGNRSDIENDFISRLSTFEGTRSEFEPINKELLVSYGKDKFIYPGESYQSMDVTRNTYLEAQSLNPVWDAGFPLESIANLFIFPSDKYGDTKVNMTILKHEYGEKETITVSLNQLLAVCEDEGCIPFWGVEKYEDGNLEGALFLYTLQKGYDHVLKIECNPVDVINGTGEIKATASLFIPTNNVDNLYAPYVKKTDKKKIKYEE